MNVLEDMVQNYANAGTSWDGLVLVGQHQTPPRDPVSDLVRCGSVQIRPNLLVFHF